jgi:hypothetical protein
VHSGVETPPLSHVDVPAVHPDPRGDYSRLRSLSCHPVPRVYSNHLPPIYPGHNASHADGLSGKAKVPFQWPSPSPSTQTHQDKLCMPSSKRRPTSVSSGPPMAKQKQINTSPCSGINTGNEQQAQQQQAQHRPVQPQSPGVQVGASYTCSFNLDFADVSVGGGDVLDSFDFDSFLNTDEVDKCFEGIEFEEDPEAEDTDMQSILVQPSQIPSDAGAGALGAEACRVARRLSRSTKEISRSRSRSSVSSRDTPPRCRKSRSRSPSTSRERSELPVGQLGTATGAVVGELADNDRKICRQKIKTGIANDDPSSRLRARHHSKDAKQYSLKRSQADAFPSYGEGHAAFALPSRRSLLPRAPTRDRAESFRREVLPANDDSDKKSTESPSSLQALLDRWLDAGAAAVLLEPS